VKFEMTYQPKDHRYNQNYDEIGFGVKNFKLNEDINVREKLLEDTPFYKKNIFNGKIDYSKGTNIGPLRNF
jgi:hypothetical protein